MENPLRLIEPSESDVPVWTVSADGLESWLDAQTAPVADWVRRHRFEAKPGVHLTVPGDAGAVVGVVLGVTDPIDLWDSAGLSGGLGPGSYRLDVTPERATQAALGWALGCYEFKRYKAAGDSGDGAAHSILAWPQGATGLT